MGFLDHSTNNIIIDAVLTDYGRQLLAQNNGQFKIEYFSLADDEVDYGIIKKFGRTVGKEKITKNTPIFEAQTKGSSAIKHRLLTLPNPSISRMPSIALFSNDQEASGIIDFTKVGNTYNPLEVSLVQQVGPNGATSNPDGLTDAIFTVYINSRFLEVDGGVQLSEEPVSRVAAYSITPAVGGGRFSFNLITKNLTTETFTQYGIVSGNHTEIVTPISIIGDQTGLRKDFKVRIKNN